MDHVRGSHRCTGLVCLPVNQPIGHWNSWLPNWLQSIVWILFKCFPHRNETKLSSKATLLKELILCCCYSWVSDVSISKTTNQHLHNVSFVYRWASRAQQARRAEPRCSEELLMLKTERWAPLFWAQWDFYSIERWREHKHTHFPESIPSSPKYQQTQHTHWLPRYRDLTWTGNAGSV